MPAGVRLPHPHHRSAGVCAVRPVMHWKVSMKRSLLVVALALVAVSFVDCSAEPKREVCGDGIDNDGNGLTDCQDRDCAGQVGCEPPNYGSCPKCSGVHRAVGMRGQLHDRSPDSALHQWRVHRGRAVRAAALRAEHRNELVGPHVEPALGLDPLHQEEGERRLGGRLRARLLHRF
ncbi:MAG: hypothetical protein EB084_25730 [Proteobacteria bacterium]|nr:hypothetical protein [Pseudomonadota bacterium]